MSVSVWAFLAVVALNLYVIGAWWWADRRRIEAVAELERIREQLVFAQAANDLLAEEVQRLSNVVVLHPALRRRGGEQ